MLIFWTMLWNGLKDKKHFDPPLNKTLLIMEHSASYFCLLVEYIFLNTIAFPLRHFYGFLPVLIAYMFVNIGYSLSDGKPVYPPLNWTKPMGFVFGFGCLLLFFLI